MTDARRLALIVLLGLWLLAMVLSLHAIATAPPGLRMPRFLGWQGAAAVPAVAAWLIGRHWPPESGVRTVSRVPLRLALSLAAVLAGLIALARLAG